MISQEKNSPQYHGCKDPDKASQSIQQYTERTQNVIKWGIHKEYKIGLIFLKMSPFNSPYYTAKRTNTIVSKDAAKSFDRNKNSRNEGKPPNLMKGLYENRNKTLCS